MPPTTYPIVKSRLKHEISKTSTLLAVSDRSSRVVLYFMIDHLKMVIESSQHNARNMWV
jgi:hypothetical protein